MELPWVYVLGPLAMIGREQPLKLQLVNAHHGICRQALERFIRMRFAEQYQANIQHFMPCLLGLQTPIGEVQGAVGLRSAENRELFLERYLDLPIEQAILEQSGKQVARSEIVEVGNLAAQGRGTARLLIVALTDLLIAQGFRWVVFTGTPTLLRNSFGRLGLETQSLGLAQPTRMGDELVHWGSYYDSRPQVMLAEIDGGHQRLLQQGVYARLGYQPLFAGPGMPHVACS